MANSTTTSFVPTYNLTWRKVINSWDRMAKDESLPTVLDRSYLRGMAGSAQTSYLTLAKQFGLVDDQNAPTERLRQLVYTPESRPQIVRQLLYEHYAPIVELGQKYSTAQELMNRWKETYGQDGETRVKAIRFYLQAAEFAGIQVSQLWKKGISAETRQASATQRNRSHSTRRRGPQASPSDLIRFADGAGTLRISVDVDPFRLSSEDRDFVFQIVDAVREYQTSHRTDESDLDETAED